MEKTDLIAIVLAAATLTAGAVAGFGVGRIVGQADYLRELQQPMPAAPTELPANCTQCEDALESCIQILVDAIEMNQDPGVPLGWRRYYGP